MDRIAPAVFVGRHATVLVVDVMKNHEGIALQERRQQASLLAARCNQLEHRATAPPVILIHGHKFPSMEVIARAMANSVPVIRVEFVGTEQGEIVSDFLAERTPSGLRNLNELQFQPVLVNRD